jgi:hypothetical protein
MPTPKISEYNREWGICGFTSALTHVYERDERLQEKIGSKDKDKENMIKVGLLTEVVIFLKLVTADHNDLIKDLEALNRDLESKAFEDGGVAGFIKAAEAAIRRQKEKYQEKDIKDIAENLYQCALTPEALTLYLQEMCVYKNAKLTMSDVPGKAGILGLYKGGKLQHWVYRAADGNVYNWGSVISPEDWETHEHGLAATDEEGRKIFDRVGCHISFK